MKHEGLSVEGLARSREEGTGSHRNLVRKREKEGSLPRRGRRGAAPNRSQGAELPEPRVEENEKKLRKKEFISTERAAE